MKYYATFNRGQPLASYYVEVPADTSTSAFELLCLMYTTAWHRLVSEEDKAAVIDARGLIEAKWGLLNAEVS
jgi:hypothetical protein